MRRVVERNNHYLLSGFENKDFASGETSKGHDKTSPTHNKPKPGRLEVGAEAKSTINDSTDIDQATAQKDIRYRLDTLSGIDNQTKDLLKGKAKNLKDLIRHKGLGFLGGKQIAEMYGSVFQPLAERLGYNPLHRIDKLLQRMASDRSNWATIAEKIDNRWSKLTRTDPHTYNQLSDKSPDSYLWLF